VVGAATLALDPHRAVLLERSDGRTLSRVHVGWARDGRAAITEQGPDGQLAITASHLALLPALVMQILRLHPGIPAPRERRAITTTAAAIDRHLLDVAARGHATGDELGALLTHWSGAWRATGSWQDRPADRSVTAVNAGPLGLWTLDRRDDAGTSTPDSPVRLLPADPSAVIAVLGDVVTGRRSPRPATPATVPG
jgi:hypothetical protein